MTTTKEAVWKAGLKTTILLASLAGLLVAIGFLIGGPGTAAVFLVIAIIINFFSYFFSDKIALKMNRAQPASREQQPQLYADIEELATRAGLPMPRVYIVQSAQANAFATGRNPRHAAVAVTSAIMTQLSNDELKGVLAHELSHIKHYDILISSVAAAIGACISYVAYILLWVSDDNSPVGVIASLAAWILAPIAASIIQMAVSRQREFAADSASAQLTGNPEWLASALLRLEESSKAAPMKVNHATEPLYIIKPFSGKGIAGLFNSHPPTSERIRRLREIRPSL